MVRHVIRQGHHFKDQLLPQGGDEAVLVHCALHEAARPADDVLFEILLQPREFVEDGEAVDDESALRHPVAGVGRIDPAVGKAVGNEVDHLPRRLAAAVEQLRRLGNGAADRRRIALEAAGQGVVAGLNAGLAALGRDPITLGRHTSYIGVLVDDLVTRGVDEPYRLFTSRSEFRLTVRQDNALERLAPIALELGVYSKYERDVVQRRFDADREARILADETSIRPEDAATILSDADSRELAHSVKISELAKRQNVSLAALFAAVGVGSDLDPAAVISTELEIKYAGYFDRERVQADKLKRMGEFALPDDLDYTGMSSLTFEARHKLTALRPRSLAQVSRIPGVSPSDIQNLVIEVERRRR